MNKNVKNLVVAGLACVALCGTTLAAPHGGNGGRAHGKAPTHQKAPAPKPAQHRAHAPGHHGTAGVRHAPLPQRHAPARHVVVHHAPPPPPAPVVVHHVRPLPPPPPAPVVVHHECHTGTGLGALLGAVVGGIIGAAL